MYRDLIDNGLNELLGPIQELIDLPDELFTDNKIEIVSTYLSAALEGDNAAQLRKAFAKKLDELVTTEEEADSIMEIFKGAFAQFVSENNIQNKRKLIIVNNLVDSILQMFQDSIDEYFGNNIPTVYFELAHSNAKLPTYAHETDAGADIYLPEDITIPPAARGVMVHTGLKAALPVGWEFQVRPRSGLSAKTSMRISNSPGTIDAGYRGEICVLVDNLSGAEIKLSAGDRIAQLIFSPVYHFKGVVVPDINSFESDRGKGGFGSSGN